MCKEVVTSCLLVGRLVSHSSLDGPYRLSPLVNPWSLFPEPGSHRCRWPACPVGSGGRHPLWAWGPCGGLRAEIRAYRGRARCCPRDAVLWRPAPAPVHRPLWCPVPLLLTGGGVLILTERRRWPPPGRRASSSRTPRVTSWLALSASRTPLLRKVCFLSDAH